jgi:hypothetical protein
MGMKLSQAKAECESWFAHLQRQENRSKALQLLAADRRAGLCDAREGERRRIAIQGNGLTVYDGANLCDAVKVLLKAVTAKEPSE